MDDEGASAPEKKPSFLKTILLYFLKAAIAGGLIVWVVLRDKEAILRTLDSLPGYVLPLTALFVFLQITATAYRWNCLLRVRGFQVSQWATFVLTFEGVFANLFLPAGAVGGDVIKAGLIAARMPEGSRIEAALSIFVDRVVGMIGLFLPALLIFLALLPEFGAYPHIMQVLALIIGGMSAAGLGIAVLLFFPDLMYRWNVTASIIRFLDRKMKNAVTRMVDSVAVYRKYWKTILILSIFSAFVIQPFLVCGVSVSIKAAEKHPVNFFRIFAATTYSNTIATLPATPGGLGTRDETLREFIHHWGAERGTAATAAVVYTSAILINYLIGGLFFLLPVLPRKNGVKQE